MPDNSTKTGARARKAELRIFQVAYDEALLVTRAELLKSRGYAIDSALGNEDAMQALSRASSYNLFIVGHAADLRTRQEMAEWIRAQFPSVKILALNPLYHPELAAADYNVWQDGPEAWLGVLETAFA